MMKPRTYNTLLMLVLSMLFIWMGVAASIQSDRREEMQNRLNSECKVLAQGKDFIANTNGCYIKHEQLICHSKWYSTSTHNWILAVRNIAFVDGLI